MGGKVWSRDEETAFWQDLIPHSPKRLGKDREENDERTWHWVAAKMGRIMGNRARRDYTHLSVFEHYFQNACLGRFSPNARKLPLKYYKYEKAKREAEEAAHAANIANAEEGIKQSIEEFEQRTNSSSANTEDANASPADTEGTETSPANSTEGTEASPANTEGSDASPADTERTEDSPSDTESSGISDDKQAAAVTEPAKDSCQTSVPVVVAPYPALPPATHFTLPPIQHLAPPSTPPSLPSLQSLPSRRAFMSPQYYLDQFLANHDRTARAEDDGLFVAQSSGPNANNEALYDQGQGYGHGYGYGGAHPYGQGFGYPR